MWPAKQPKALSVGAKYGRWCVTGPAAARGSKSYSSVVCECGVISEVQHWCLTSGKSESCGCLCKERAKAKSTKHGMSRTPEYAVWAGILQRCQSTSRHNSHRYVGKGIAVCEAWQQSFESFYKDMGAKPTTRHQVDRIDNSKGYSPENCRWASPKENARNRDNSISVALENRTVSLKDLAEELCIQYHTLYYRYMHGCRGAELVKPLRIKK